MNKEEIKKYLNELGIKSEKLNIDFEKDCVHIYGLGFNTKIPNYEFEYSNVPIKEILEKYLYSNWLFKNGWHEWDFDEEGNNDN